MSTDLDPGEDNELRVAKRSTRQSCAHCVYIAMLGGPAIAPYRPEALTGPASLYCRAHPPVAMLSKAGVLGVHPPVRPNGWCGHFEEWSPKEIKQFSGDH